MENKNVLAFRSWLENVMPQLVEAISDNFSTEIILEMGSEQGVHGPYTFDISSLHAPLTALELYFVVVADTMTFSVEGVFENARESNDVNVSFDFFCSISEFSATLSSEEQMKALVDKIVNQYKEVA